MQRVLFDAVYDAAYRNQPPDQDHLLWKLTPFIDYPGVYGQREYKWEWEREWRKRGDLAFAPDDIRFVFAPQSHHPAVQSRWAAAAETARLPVLLDAAWPLKLIQRIAAREDL